jgi:cellobiose phosphorylase
LEIDPCIPSDWKGFEVSRKWRGATFNVKVENPSGVQKGVKEIFVNGAKVEKIVSANDGEIVDVRVVMG